jgi:hypothetical protein
MRMATAMRMAIQHLAERLRPCGLMRHWVACEEDDREQGER